MKETSFYKLFFAIVFSLLFLIVIFSLFLLQRSPVVREVRFSTNFQNLANIENQQISVSFSTPFYDSVQRQSNFAQRYVSVFPETGFRTTWVGSTLFITFEDTLSSATKYTVEINKDLADLYGNSLAENIEIELQTEILEFAYLQKNSRENFANRTRVEDFIFLYSLEDSKPKEIYSDISITNYKIYEDWLAVEMQNEDFTDSVKLVNIESGEQISIFDTQVLVRDIEFISSTNSLYIVAQPAEVNRQLQFALPTAVSSVYQINLENLDLKKVEISELVGDLEYIEVLSDNSTLIIKDIADSTNYLSNINNLSELAPVGKFVSFSTGTKDGSNLLFSTLDFANQRVFPYLVEIDSARTQKFLTDFSTSSIDASYIFSDTNIIFAQKREDTISSKGIFDVVIIDREGAEKERFSDSQFSLELPKPSLDNSFFVAEAYNIETLSDVVNSRLEALQPRPIDSEIRLYNLENGEFTNIGRGIKIQWR